MNATSSSWRRSLHQVRLGPPGKHLDGPPRHAETAAVWFMASQSFKMPRQMSGRMAGSPMALSLQLAQKGSQPS